MKIIISPAKKMNVENDFLAVRSFPVYLREASDLWNYLKSLPFETLKAMLDCNDRIARLAFERYQNLDLRQNLSPALLAYEGIQYQYMAPRVFEREHFQYAEEHLRILSGLYGILRPLDGVVPYRLELDAKLNAPFAKNLYDFWGDKLYRELVKQDDEILNLASAQYSRSIKKYVQKNIRYLTCRFGTPENGRIKEKGVYVKMARGEMVRFMAENNITRFEDLKQFDRLGYRFSREYSDDKQYVFLQADGGGK